MPCKRTQHTNEDWCDMSDVSNGDGCNSFSNMAAKTAFCSHVSVILKESTSIKIYKTSLDDIMMCSGSWLTCCRLSGTGPQSEIPGGNHLDPTVVSICSAGFSHAAHADKQQGKNMTTSNAPSVLNIELPFIVFLQQNSTHSQEVFFAWNIHAFIVFFVLFFFVVVLFGQSCTLLL